MMLYHYFDSKIGPFRNLSDLPDEEADRVILQFRQQKRDSHPTFSDKITDGKEYHIRAFLIKCTRLHSVVYALVLSEFICIIHNFSDNFK